MAKATDPMKKIIPGRCKLCNISIWPALTANPIHKNAKIKGMPTRDETKLVKILMVNKIENNKMGRLIKSI